MLDIQKGRIRVLPLVPLMKSELVSETKIELKNVEELTNNLKGEIAKELAKKLDKLELRTNNTQIKKKVPYI